ncbi:hypothetical protein [Evansella clarkii]|uniref:hypothetical protein n=1 Tax=Evansella clarkii TaxID=79879 RepID=UPI000B44C9FF|nr:hypothetical protein [Evansella clarkii]
MGKITKSIYKKRHKKERSDDEKIIEGIALSIVFLSLSILLYINPDFFEMHVITHTIGAILGLIGLIGFTIEISKTRFKITEGISEFVTGIILSIIPLLLLFHFYVWYVNILSLFIGMFALYGLFLGLIKIINQFVRNEANIFIKIPALLLNGSIFILTLLQIIEIIS